MNNMTEKVIKDGSETRRAKFNMITSIIGGVLLSIGILLLVIKGMSVEYIDANGILHENFFLVPIGFMCIFCGLISFVSIGIRTIVIKIKDRNDQFSNNQHRNFQFVNLPFEIGEILFPKGFFDFMDIRKLQDKAKTSYTLSTRRPRFGYE